MKTLKKIKQLQNLFSDKTGTYDIDYVYDAKERVSQEVIIGDVNRTTTYTYNEINDNTLTETIVEGGITTQKTYEYHPTSNNVVKIKIKKI